MLVEIKVPVLPESVTEGTLGAWHKQVGDTVKESEHIVDLETDKVVLEIVATSAGVITSIDMEEGATVTNNQILGKIDTEAVSEQPVQEAADTPATETRAGPAARKLLKQNELPGDAVDGTGPKGAVTRQDVERHLKSTAAKADSSSPAASVSAPATDSTEHRNDRRVPMSRMRSRIAERLKEAQNSAAMLTTFNEVDLKQMMDIRNTHKEAFEKAHGVKLGMMSFFTKAAVEALKRFPSVNASIDGKDIVYHDYFDIGIAVSSERGLVVPIIRDADELSYADIELAIRGMGAKARDGKLGIDDLTGGTFSITNGGVFGSMLSTPILNPPQSAILGMHNIQQRVVVVNGEMVIRPMMYLALTYDHRIIDGREAVQFLVTIKGVLEDPARLILQV
jgi:2-oxoglutarate dehydrogenase E2 component (dihydrolipoamide succinyltransferase)